MVAHRRFSSSAGYSITGGTWSWRRDWRDWTTCMKSEPRARTSLMYSASTALAAARREAQMYGHERREQIKRRINESRVLRELETMEPGALPPQLIAPPASGPDSK